MLSPFKVIELTDTDSTNNYAMQLIDANKAQHGMTITAQTQYAGKGQRGKLWADIPGNSLLMSIIALPGKEINYQFVFNAAVTSAVANALEEICPSSVIHIKWPNDIIINDKKAGGILIENVIRGSQWTHAVIGIGLNVKQVTFPENLPFAISLKIATGNDIDLISIRDSIIENIIHALANNKSAENIMSGYNQRLYKRGQKQAFNDNTNIWEATILNAHKDGTLEVELLNGTKAFYHHGQVLWHWG